MSIESTLDRISAMGTNLLYIHPSPRGTAGVGLPAGPGCAPPSDFGVLPTLAIGARIHMGDNVSFTARIGYPTITFGVSFL